MRQRVKNLTALQYRLCKWRGWCFFCNFFFGSLTSFKACLTNKTLPLTIIRLNAVRFPVQYHIFLFNSFPQSNEDARDKQKLNGSVFKIKKNMICISLTLSLCDSSLLNSEPLLK